MGGDGEAYFRYLDALVKEGLSEEMMFTLRPTVAGRMFQAERPAHTKALKWVPALCGWSEVGKETELERLAGNYREESGFHSVW